MKRRQRLAPRSRPRCQSSRPRPLHTHIPPLCDPWPRPLGNRPGAGPRVPLRRLHTRVGDGGGERGAERPREGAGEGRGCPGCVVGGRRRGRDSARRAAARSGGRAGGAGGQAGQGDPESSMKSPGPRTGRCPGEAVGGSRHPWLGGSRGGALGVSRGWGPAARGGGGGGRVTPGPTRAGGRGWFNLGQRRLFRAPWSRFARAARLRGFFGNLQMFS